MGATNITPRSAGTISPYRTMRLYIFSLRRAFIVGRAHVKSSTSSKVMDLSFTTALIDATTRTDTPWRIAFLAASDAIGRNTTMM